MRHPVLLVAALALCACKPAPEMDEPIAPSNPPPAAATPASPPQFSGDLNALGTEPFWAVEIRQTTLKLSRPDAADVVVPNPGPKVEGEKGVWSAPGLVLTLTPGQCSDGMSDRTYPWYAEVTTVDATQKGCATRTQELAEAPKP
jgi:uncharacterized membrane protein